MSVKTVKPSGKGSKASARPRLGVEVPPIALIAVGLVVLLALGAGVFYVVNGGWQTEGQKQWKFEHETAPIAAARQGRTDMLEEENRRRKTTGEPQLQFRDRHGSASNVRQGLEGLQSRFSHSQAP